MVLEVEEDEEKTKDKVVESKEEEEGLSSGLRHLSVAHMADRL